MTPAPEASLPEGWPSTLRRLVVKVGTRLLTAEDGGIDLARLQSLAAQISTLRKQGLQVVLVSSGAVGLGIDALGLKRRPPDLPMLQACAAVGQARLVHLWQTAFDAHDLQVAQVLLTHDDVRSRRRHVAVGASLDQLLRLGIVPIINENDTISAEEIKFGDNDKLSAMAGVLVRAELLAILTSVTGLLNPESGELIAHVPALTPEIEAMATGTNDPRAVGGMTSKLSAARLATEAGCAVFIGHGRDPSILLQLAQGQAVGTFFVPAAKTAPARKAWLRDFTDRKGSLVLDDGAVRALRRGGTSLLAPGIAAVDGDFNLGDPVALQDATGTVIGHGLTRFAAADLRPGEGTAQTTIVVHCDDLALL